MAEHPAPPTPRAADAAGPSGPLHGLRVLDLTAVVLGPIATQILGDMGADVIKIEGLEGDLMRANGVSRHAGMSSIFLAINRNKRSVAIDLKSEEGRRTLERLIATVDIVVHNMRVPAIERLGLGYDAVRAIKPDIIYCVATGFGQQGPHRHKPAFDDIIQAACGLAGLIGGIADKPDYVPTLLADKVCGILLANAVLAATVHHARSGQGQYVEVPMLESMTAFTLAEHLGGLTFEPPTAPPGYARILGAGRKPAPTRDGYIAMLPYTARHWQAFFEMAGRPELADRYQVADRFARNRHVTDLYRDMHAITRQRTTAEWLRICDELDIPASPVRGLADLLDDEHLRAVGLFEHGEHPTEGPIRYVRPTTLFSETPTAVRRPAPTLGQDTDEVLREAGLSDAQIQTLKDKGVLRASSGSPQAPR
ncbi:MAG: CoA transferase [Burkholderiaceae bacterium]